MKEIREVINWIQTTGRTFHKTILVERLPDPTFSVDGRASVSFSTNNYLSLATSPRMIAKARYGLDKYGVGNCESRLLGGDLDIYRELEGKLAKMKHKEDAILFATGYLTNLGVLSSLVNWSKIGRVYGFRPSTHYKYAYFTDEYNHTSIREGVKMSGANKVSYRHCDMNDLEKKLKVVDAHVKIIVSDGVFSQDGDIVPLPDLMQLAEKYDCLVYVDDAHGTGVLGPNGGGTTEYFNLYPSRLICMGTLSKAYGAIGGFIATDRDIAEILRLTCSAYGFTSTLTPDQAYAISEAMDMVVDEPERRERLWANQRYFVAQMDKLGYHLISRATPIVPVLIGDEMQCEKISATLEENGIHVDAICFPAVPLGKSRLRFMMNTNHTKDQIDRVVTLMAELKRTNPIDLPEEIKQERVA
jgi:glycine C-acetyltransferase